MIQLLCLVYKSDTVETACMVIAIEKKMTLSLLYIRGQQNLTRQSILVKINKNNETKVRLISISKYTSDTSSILEP